MDFGALNSSVWFSLDLLKTASIEGKFQSTEGDIGGFWIPQNRKKNWQIPHYRKKIRQIPQYRKTSKTLSKNQWNNEIVALHNLKITGKY